MRSTLRPHQVEAIRQLKLSIGQGDRRPVLQLPTGAGKTVVAAAIVDGARSKGNRVIFTVPAISLIDQTVQSFWNEGITEVGVIQADHPMTNPTMPVQVASIQTLQRRGVPDTDIVVVDECHRLFQFYGEWMARPEWQHIPFIGLSATPWTRGLGQHFTNLIVGATTRELIDAGYLSEFEVFAPSHPDLSEVRTVAGDYHEGDLSDAMNQTPLIADVVQTWLEMGGNDPTLCFAVDRAHAKHLQERFHAAGVACGYVDAHSDLDEREQLRKDFHNGDIRVVCNVGVLTTGVDWDVRCLILARPTKSKMLFVQIIGRALRTAEGKSKARILDHSDTHLRLGLVTDINQTVLDDGKPRTNSGAQERDEPLPKECPQCSFLKPAKVRECPHCGFETAKQTDIESEDGELVAFGGKASKASKKYVPTPAEKRTFFAQLRGYALTHEKTEKWVLANYRDKFDEWPHQKHGVEPEPPTETVLNWLKHKRIKWAKSKARQAA